METIIIYTGFLLLGISVGFLTFLILRIGIHQHKFKWAGALSVVSTLAGGGFITYLSRPIHFGLYSIGFFIGIILYVIYLSLAYKEIIRTRFSKTGRMKDEIRMLKRAKSIYPVKYSDLLSAILEDIFEIPYPKTKNMLDKEKIEYIKKRAIELKNEINESTPK